MKSAPSFRYCLFLAVLFLLPLFFSPGLGLVDDPHIVQVGRDFARLDLETSVSWLRETENGRFRPFYMLGTALYSLLGGTNIQVWSILQIGMLASFLFLIGQLLRPFFPQRFSAFLLIVVSLWPSMAANLYRFGTAEPRQALFLLLAVLWVEQNRTFGMLVAWLAALWSKETNLFFLPALLWWNWWSSPQSFRKKIPVSLLITGFAVVTWLLIPTSVGYARGFSLSWRTALHIFFVHAPTAWPESYYGLLLALALWSMILGEAWRSGKKQWGVLKGASWLVSALFLLTPALLWSPPLERYLLPFNVFLTVALAVGIKEWWHRFGWRKQSLIWYTAVATLLLVAVPPWQWVRAVPATVIRSGREVSTWTENYAVHGPLSGWLLANRIERIYFDSDDLEYSHSAGLYAANFDPNIVGMTLISSFSFSEPIYRFSPSPREAFQFECSTGESCVLITASAEGVKELGSVNVLSQSGAWRIVQPF